MDLGDAGVDHPVSFGGIVFRTELDKSRCGGCASSLVARETSAEDEALFGILCQVNINTTADVIIVIIEQSMEEGIDVAASENRISVFLQRSAQPPLIGIRQPLARHAHLASSPGTAGHLLPKPTQTRLHVPTDHTLPLHAQHAARDQ